MPVLSLLSSEIMDTNAAYGFCSQCLNGYTTHRAGALDLGSTGGLQTFWEPFDLYTHFGVCGQLVMVG